MRSALIPCPVCGGELHVLRSGTATFVDCAHGHHAATEPALYEQLRLRLVVEDIARFLSPGSTPEPCAGHQWTPIEEHPDIQLVICRDCLAVAVVAGSR